MRIQVDRIFASIQGKKILKDLSLTVDSGQSLALIGPNGSGKSTLLRVIAGLLRMDSGAVLIGDDLSAVALLKTTRTARGFCIARGNHD